MMVRWLGIVSIILLFCICACSQEEKKVVEKSEPKKVILSGDDNVLATVNNTPISEYEVTLTANETFGKERAKKLDNKGRQKVLKSLVAKRAVSLLAEAELTPKDQAEIDKKMAAYKEELLIKKYLSDHIKPEPVTHGMVKAYYENHPEKYGAKTIRSYEMVTTKTALKPFQRDQLMKKTDLFKSGKEWEIQADKLKQSEFPVVYSKGRVTENLFPEKLDRMIAKMVPGEVSNLIFIKGTPYMVHLLEEKKIPPKPLRQVSGLIRKSLVPVQLKKAVKKASQQALEKVTVNYVSSEK